MLSTNSTNHIICLWQFDGVLNSSFGWSCLLFGLGFVTVIVRHRTWLFTAWFGLTLGFQTAMRSDSEQTLVWCDRIGDRIRAQSHPRPRTSQRVVSGQWGGCKAGRLSGSHCSGCCHVAVWIWEQSSKRWDLLNERKTAVNLLIMKSHWFACLHLKCIL